MDYLGKYNITPLASQEMNLHLMISDPKETYVVEFINNKIVAKPQYIMTNYHLCLDSIPDYAVILAENYEKGGEMMNDEENINKLNAILEEDAGEWQEELEYVKEHGLCEESEWWDTANNTIYDIRNKKVWVTVHEWYDQKAEFNL